MKNKLFIFLLCFILFFIYIFLHPSKETMTCDKNLKCTVSRTYIGFVDIKSQINLSENSYINPKDSIRGCSGIKYNPGPRTCTHVIHLQILNKNGKLVKPFIGYYSGYESRFEDKSLDIVQGEINQFKRYIKNPNSQFYIEAPTGNYLLLYTILGTIFAFIMYYIFNFVEDLLKKFVKIVLKK